MKRIILIFLIFISVGAIAQPSGYCGKRFMIGYSNYFFPALYGPTATGDMGVNLNHCLDIEYVRKSRSMLCVSAEYSKTGVHGKGELLYRTPDLYGGYTDDILTYSPSSQMPVQLSSLNIGLGVKVFYSGYLAPLGKYFKPELLVMMQTLTYEPKGFSSSSSYSGNNYRTINVGPGEFKYKSFALAATIGRQRVLFDKLVFDYGFRVGVVPAGLFSVLAEDGQYNTVQTKMKREKDLRMLRYQLFNIHIGIKFLAF